jgi:hypothetical protein
MRTLHRAFLLALALLPSAANAQATPVDVVRKLYADYAWETRDSEVGTRLPLFADSAAVLQRYLDRPLLRASLADQACEARTAGVCNLDFDPMWDSQDPGGATVTIAATKDPVIVQARIRYPNDRALHVVTYRLRRTPDGWRIADMSNPKWRSLLELLRRQVQ